MYHAPVRKLPLLLVLLAAPGRADPAYLGLETPDPSIRPPAPRPGELAGVADRPRVARVLPVGNQGSGALSGKTVYISDGHGWYWTGTAWTTQRGNSHGIVEDFSNAEIVDEFLIPALRNLGAHVVPIREPDRNPARVIVDDGDAAIEGTVSELDCTDAGWGDVTLPIPDATYPFETGGARLLTTAAAETGRLVYPIAVPASGDYDVYISYVQGPDRAPDAHWSVRHAGGETHFRVDQRRHGSTWVLLGRFRDPSAVTLANDSASPGTVASADAVRAGGGLVPIARGGVALDRPAYEAAGRYFAQFDGAPTDVWDYRVEDNNDDVVTRSRFSAWEHEAGEDAVFISWHSNATGGAATSRGTDLYTYGPNGPPSPVSEFTGTDGSLELQAALALEIGDDIRAAYDAAWPTVRSYTAYFGEINPAHNGEMPQVLIELAYHDNVDDAACLADPRFRKVAAIAVAHAIARYFAERDGLPLVLPPATPQAVRIAGDGDGGLVLSWRAPAEDPQGGAAPAGYRVYLSTDGYAYDDGTDVTETSLALPALGAGAARYARVAAVNAGGESFPTEVVGARVPAAGHAPVLVVGGFDRLEASQDIVEDLSAYSLGLVDRVWIDQINDGSYAARHGAAILAAGRSFDGASDEAISLGDVALTPYRAVDWFLGEESSGDEPFSGAAQVAVADYVAAGGRLLVTGSEIGWALSYLGTTEEQAFYAGALHGEYLGDDAETYALAPVAAGIYDGLTGLAFDDVGPGGYDAEYPDQLGTANGATAAMEYSGGTAGTAALTWIDADARGVLFGFPFETIAGADDRAEVMRRTLDFLEVEEPTAPDAAPTTPDAGPAAPDAGGGDDNDGDCDCRAGGRGAPLGGALLLGLVLALGLLRHRRP
jgi:hypothetical protein